MTILTQPRSLSILAALKRSLAAGVVLFAASSAWAFQSSAGGAPKGGAPLTGGTRNAPEINPALIVGAVVLVVGCILIVTSRRRRTASPSQS